MYFGRLARRPKALKKFAMLGALCARLGSRLDQRLRRSDACADSGAANVANVAEAPSKFHELCLGALQGAPKVVLLLVFL